MTLTTAPLAAASSFLRPRASMMGAKKLTWNTVFQSSAEVSIVLSLAPPGFFGLIAALLTSACSFEPCSFSFSFISPIATSRSAMLARSTWMWSSGPASHGQSSAKGMPRAGDHPPAGGRKALHRRMADAARRAGKDQRFALAVGGLGHGLAFRRWAPDCQPVRQRGRGESGILAQRAAGEAVQDGSGRASGKECRAPAPGP